MSDAAVTPQWHQWLRHTRPEPPSIQEQAADISRQSQLKHNAALADARWAAKAKYIEKPKPQPQSDQFGSTERDEVAKPDTHKMAVNPGSDYQPEGWIPGANKR